MIQSINEQEYVFASNTDALKFSTTDLRTRSASCQFPGWLNHNEGSSQFNLVAGGIYEIDFNANITSATTGVVGVALFADGVQVNGTESDAVVNAANEYSNVNIKKYLRVCGRGSVSLTINSVPVIDSVDTEVPTIKNANIIIRRYA